MKKVLLLVTVLALGFSATAQQTLLGLQTKSELEFMGTNTGDFDGNEYVQAVYKKGEQVVQVKVFKNISMANDPAIFANFESNPGYKELYDKPFGLGTKAHISHKHIYGQVFRSQIAVFIEGKLVMITSTAIGDLEVATYNASYVLGYMM